MTNYESAQQIALVTGASGGLGLEICLALQRKGFKVTAATRKPEHFKKLIAERLAAHSGQMNTSKRLADVELDDFQTLALDLSFPEQTEQIVKEWCHQIGRLDLLVNNAGFAAGGLIEDVPLEVWREQMEVNVFGLIAVTRAVIPTMREWRSGKIMNISSISGLVGLPGFGPYAASKFAVEGFSESLRHELRRTGIHTVLFELGAYNTGIWEKGFAAMSEPKHADNIEKFQSIKDRVKLTAANAGDPAEAARYIASVAAMKRPRLRYVIGRSTNTMYKAKKYLPWKLWEKIIARAMFGRNKE